MSTTAPSAGRRVAVRDVCDAAYQGRLLRGTTGRRDEVAKVMPRLTAADERLAQGPGVLDEASRWARPTWFTSESGRSRPPGARDVR